MTGLMACTALASGALAFGSMAFAQTETGQLETIVVTARKTAEPLQQVPLAITAFTAQDMVRRGVREAADLSSITPGLMIEKDQGRRLDRPVIRGQSNVLGVPNAASFIDGVYIPDSLFATELAFVERVEVIKGPQSALYGRQTFSGAISYITKQPTTTTERMIRLTGAQYGEFNGLATISGPLTSNLFGQASLNYYTYAGHFKNNAPGDPSNGRKIGGEKTIGGTFGLLYKPTDQFQATFKGTIAHNDDDHETMALQRASKNNCFLNRGTQYYCGEIHISPSDLSLNLDSVGGGGVSRDTERASLNMVYDAGVATVTSITGFNHSFESRKADTDFINLNVAAQQVNDTINTKGWSQELRATTDAAKRVSALAGVYYFHGNTRNWRYRYNPGIQTDNGAIIVDNYAAFGLLRLRATDKLTGTAEVRVATDELKLVGGAANFNLSGKFNSTNPRFTLDYQATPNFLVYGLIAKGNKPGGFNADARLAPNQLAYGEESAWNYEAGFKSEWFEHRLRLNVAAFHIDWSNQQLTQATLLPALGTSVTYILNIGELEVNGAELELQGQVDRHVTLRATYSLAESKYTNATDIEVGTLTGNPSINGNMAPNAPRIQWSAGVYAWVPAFNDYRWFVDASYSFRSRKYDQVGNFAYVDGRGNANLQLGLDMGKSSLILFVRNAFNNLDSLAVTRYVDFGNLNRRGFLGTIPRPRQIGLTYELNF
jgi:outer membrane receptor protein involved in Fe transport